MAKIKKEVMLVPMDNGLLIDTTIYSLGHKDQGILNNIFENFTKDGVLESGRKLAKLSEKYAYDEFYELWVDKSEDS